MNSIGPRLLLSICQRVSKLFPLLWVTRLPNQKNISQSLPHLTYSATANIAKLPSFLYPMISSSTPMSKYHLLCWWFLSHMYLIWMDFISKLQSRSFLSLQNVCLDAYRIFKINVSQMKYFIPLVLTTTPAFSGLCDLSFVVYHWNRFCATASPTILFPSLSSTLLLKPSLWNNLIVYLLKSFIVFCHPQDKIPIRYYGWMSLLLLQ